MPPLPFGFGKPGTCLLSVGYSPQLINSPAQNTAEVGHAVGFRNGEFALSGITGSRRSSLPWALADRRSNLTNSRLSRQLPACACTTHSLVSAS